MAIFSKPEDKLQAPTTDEKSASADRLRRLSAAASPRPASTSATPPSGVPAPAAQMASFKYVDRPELPETFADSITGLFFDGQSLRIEFSVSRVDEIKPNTPVSGRRYPACRLVLPPGAAVELINKMQQIGAALTKAGVVKQAEPAKS
jgi:hypothetical protein